MRNLTKTLAVVSILAPASAYPLGIGDIKLHSALNQNLNAEIALQLSGENIDDIKVKLAPPEKFDEAGVAWNYFLSKIKFSTITQANGSVVIKLTSSEALKEPFLDLLLEVSWPKGNLYREFTVLVDPPSVYNQATIPVQSSSQPVVSQQALRTESQAQRYAPQSAQVNNGSADEYGPTRKNDTLWHVAEGLSREQGVSVEQMMVALFQANPDAFYKDNVNALIAGKTLKIPEKDVVVKLSRSQALAEFNRQRQAWKNRVAPAPVKSAELKETVTDNQLKLTAPVESTVANDVVVAPGSDKSTSAQKSTATQAGNSSETAASPADAAIQTKIAALEKQLAVMQQIIALKDQQLAAIQNQAQQPQPAEVAPTPSPAVESIAVVAPEPQSVNPPAQVVPESAVASQPQAPIESAPTPQAPTPQAPAPAEVKPVEPAKTKPPLVQPTATVEESPDLIYLGAAGAGASILGALGWLWWRKRKVEEETGTESMFASSSLLQVPEDEDIFSVPVVADNTAYTVGESSFLSEFTPSDFNSFDTDQGEIDPISEADVYLAYGRYQQAEELMRHAINDHPDRDECKLKLLEIYYASENKQAFAAYADELAQAGKNKQIEFWAKVAEMGEELCPDVALFSNGDAHFTNHKTVEPESAPIDFASDADDLDLDLVTFDEIPSKAVAPREIVQESKISALDYDLTSFEVEDDTFVDEERNNQEIDFDLTAFAPESDKTEKAEKPVAESIDDLESFDFNFDLSNEDDQPIKEPAISVSEQKITPANELSLDNSLDFDSDDFDFSFDLDEDSPGSNNPNDQFAVSDLTDMDELETKLDLAKAYVDMGDMGAARDIASEVLTKGTDAQKTAAQELLDDLS